MKQISNNWIVIGWYWRITFYNDPTLKNLITGKKLLINKNYFWKNALLNTKVYLTLHFYSNFDSR